MFSRFRRDERGFFYFGGIITVVIAVIYVLLIPWFIHNHAARTHGHHHGHLIDGFLQGFFVVVGIIWHFFVNHHIAIIQGPTMTLGFLVAFILGVLAFLAAANA